MLSPCIMAFSLVRPSAPIRNIFIAMPCETTATVLPSFSAAMSKIAPVMRRCTLSKLSLPGTAQCSMSLLNLYISSG